MFVFDPIRGALVKTPNPLPIVGAITKEPTGFENTTDSTISFDSNPAVREFTIQPSVTSFDVWVDGMKFEFTSPQTVAVAAATGLTYFYYDNTGTLQSSSSFPDVTRNAIVSIVYWNNTTGDYFFCDERHGTIMDGVTHAYLHLTRGAEYASGGNCTVEGTEGDEELADNRISLTETIYYDEDIRHVLGAFAAGTNWEKWYIDAAGNWQILTGDQNKQGSNATVPNFFMDTGGGVWELGYNNITTGTIDEVTANDFVNVYVFGTNTEEAGTRNNQYIVLCGQAEHNNANSAYAETVDSLQFGQLPSPEFLPMYQITYQRQAAAGSEIGCEVDRVLDIRRTRSPGVLAGAASSHNSLSGLQGGAASEYYHLTSAEYSGTGTGIFARQDSPTFTTQIITPEVIGGTGVSGDLELESTSNATKGWVTGKQGERLSFYDNGRTGTGLDACKAFFKHAPDHNGSNHFGVISAIETNLQTSTPVSQINNGVVGISIHNQASQSVTGGLAGVQGAAQITTAANGTNVADAVGVKGVLVFAGTATVDVAAALRAEPILFGSGNITDAAGLCVQWNAGSSAYSGTLTNYYGVRLHALPAVAGAITNTYGFYQEGGTVKNYLQGTLEVDGTLTADGNLVANGGIDTDDIDSIGATLNIGGTTATTVNIGRAGQTINLLGATNVINTSDAFVSGALDVEGLITAAYSAARVRVDADTGTNGGFEIYENASKKWALYNNNSGDELLFTNASGIEIAGFQQNGQFRVRANSRNVFTASDTIISLNSNTTLQTGYTLTMNGASISGTIGGTPTWSGSHTFRWGGETLALGANLNDSALTDATRKYSTVTTRPYTNTEENVSMFHTETDTAFNLMRIGGGDSGYNAMTQIRFYLGADATSTTGTEVMRLDDDVITLYQPVTVGSTLQVGDYSTFATLTIAASAAADAVIYFKDGSGTTSWSIGKDNSASDAFAIAASGALGTSNAILVNSAGAVTLGPSAGENHKTNGRMNETLTTETANTSFTADFDDTQYHQISTNTDITITPNASETSGYGFVGYVFVRNTDASSHTITISRSNCRTLAGAGSFSLGSGKFAVIRCYRASGTNNLLVDWDTDYE
jgi:hypothetical protein